jgi:zinc transport system permease protein
MLTAVTVVLGMKVVGILLVSALLIIPAAAALQVSRSFREALILSAVLSGCSAILGLIGAFYLDWPVSGTIVSVATLLFLILFGARHRRKTVGNGLAVPGPSGR